MRLLGCETEYGMYIEGRDPSRHLDEAAALVQAYAGRCATGWDYRLEDPRRDARGYRVDALATNPEDALRPPGVSSSQADVRSDRVLTNGARLYNDHGHPDTHAGVPLAARVGGTTGPASGSCWRARVPGPLASACRCASTRTIPTSGMSYGAHENYLMARAVYFD